MKLDQLQSDIDGCDVKIEFDRLFALRHEFHNLSPNNIENLLALADLISHHEHLGGIRGATEILNASLSVGLDVRGDIMCGERIAELHMKAGDTQNALAALDVVQLRYPQNFRPRLMATKIRARTNKNNAALLEYFEEFENDKNIAINDFNNRQIFDAFARLNESKNENNVDARINFISEGRAISDVLLIFMVKDEGDIFFSNLQHHYHLGFRNFFIIDNNSSDETASDIIKFRNICPDAIVLSVFDPIVGFFQAAKTNAGFQFANSILPLIGREIKWLLPLDGDDFLCPSPSLYFFQLFSNAEQEGMQSVVFSWRYAGTSEIERPVDPNENILLRFNLRNKTPGHHVTKVAGRVRNDMSFDEGNHRLRDSFKFLSKTKFASVDGAFMLHLHMRTISHMRKKVINGGLAAKAANTGIAGHWVGWYDDYQSRGDAAIVDLLEKYCRGMD